MKKKRTFWALFALCFALCVFAAQGICGIELTKPSSEAADSFAPSNHQDLEKRCVKIFFVRDTHKLTNHSLTNLGYCHGVYVTSDLILSVAHAYSKGSLAVIAGTFAKVVKIDTETDLLLLKMEMPCSTDTKLLFETCPQPEETAVVYTQVKNNWIWQSAGVIDTIGIRHIFLSDFQIQLGDSGKPIFTPSGKLLGIIRGWTVSPHYVFIVPARNIKKFLNDYGFPTK